MKQYGVYKVTDTIGGVYVGASENPKARIKRHIGASVNCKHKWLEGKTTGEVLLYCDKHNTGFYERLCIAKFSTVLQSDGGEGIGPKGSRSQELKDRISNTLKGKYTGDKHPMFGKHHTEETKKHLSEVGKTKTGINHNSYGHKHSEKSKAKMRLARSKYKQPRSVRLKAALTNQTRTAIRKELACAI